MLDLKRFAVHVRIAPIGDEEATKSYTQWHFDAEDEMDAKRQARIHFGPTYEVMDVFGPFEILT